VAHICNLSHSEGGIWDVLGLKPPSGQKQDPIQKVAKAKGADGMTRVTKLLLSRSRNRNQTPNTTGKKFFFF
jgi:hypothetical protein